MKTNIIGTVLTAALIVFFSAAGFTPSGTQILGESCVVLPGGGNDTPNLVIRQAHETADVEMLTAETTETATEIIVEEEGEKSMDDMLLMFWHGVAAVLIGELSVLITAIACRMLYKSIRRPHE